MRKFWYIALKVPLCFCVHVFIAFAMTQEMSAPLTLCPKLDTPRSWRGPQRGRRLFGVLPEGHASLRRASRTRHRLRPRPGILVPLVSKACGQGDYMQFPVQTAFIASPGRIYADLALGLSELEVRGVFAGMDDLIIENVKVWVPVETTAFFVALPLSCQGLQEPR